MRFASKRLQILFVAICAASFVITINTQAATVNSSWNGGTGNWSDGTQWSTNPFEANNGVNGDDYLVTIASGNAALDIDVIINGLTLTNGTISGDGDLDVLGPLVWTAGTMTGAGVTNAEGGLDLSGSSHTLNGGRTLNNTAAATWTSGNFSTGQGAIFNNQLGATFNTDFDGSFVFNQGGVRTEFNNAGSFTKSGGVGTTFISALFNNTGSVHVDSGTLDLSGGGTSTGSFDALAGTTLSFGGTYDLNTGGSLTSAGDVAIISGAWNLNGGVYDVAGTTRIAGTASFNSAATINLLTLSNGILTGTSDITIDGLMTWTAGTMTGAGVTNAEGGLDLSGSSHTLNGGRTLNNTAAATWTSGNFSTGQGAIFNNQLGATFNTDFDGSFVFNQGGVRTEFNNAGSFTKSGGVGTTFISALFNNTGSVHVDSGTLDLSGGGTSTGSFDALAGTTLSFGGTYDLNTGGSLTSAGDVAIISGAWNLNGGVYDVAGTTRIAGTASFNSAATINLLTLSNGILTGTSDITIDGLMTWTAGTMTGAGVTNAEGGLDLSGSSHTLNGGRTLNNTAAATWTSGNFSTGQGAIFNNQLGATFNTDFDGSFVFNQGGVRTEFNNAGSFTKSGGVGTTFISALFNNTGSVHVDSGTLDLSGGGTSTGSFDGAGHVVFAAGMHTLNTSSFTVTNLTIQGGTVGGSGDLTPSGLFTWSGSGGTMTGSGTTIVDTATITSGSKSLGRTLQVQGDAAWTGGGAWFGVDGGGVIAIDSGGAFRYDGTNAATMNNAIDVVNNGVLERSAGTNLLNIQGSLSGTGSVSDVRVSGTHAPGNSPAAVQLHNTYELTNTATLALEIGGPTPGTEHDRLNSTGTVHLDGTLSVEQIDLGGGVYQPVFGDAFVIITATGGVTGEFDTITAINLNPILVYEAFYDDDVVTLALDSFFDADFDVDGDVDGDDFLRWQSGFGTTSGATQMNGDADEDGDVDGDDFLVWQNQFGASVGGTGAASGSAVPEPAAVWLALAGLLALAGARKCVLGA